VVVGDLEDITALVHSYAELLDAGNLDGVADLFSNATWRSAVTGTLRGSEAVRRVYDRMVLYDGSPRTKHLLTNLTITLDAEGLTAAGTCYFTVLQGVIPGEPIQVVLSGRYVDRYAKVDGRWRFADRWFEPDLLGDQSQTFR
jgi:hypothetical protein